MTTDWDNLISRDLGAVIEFANGNLSRDNFRRAFAYGNTNPARNLVVSRGVQESRQLAKKALRRRGLV